MHEHQVGDIPACAARAGACFMENIQMVGQGDHTRNLACMTEMFGRIQSESFEVRNRRDRVTQHA